jgi:hypothetical protein
MKKKNASAKDIVCGQGDVWTFIGLDSDTKLIPAFLVGKRDAYHANAFMADLAGRVKNRVQISSDALKAYEDAVERGFGSEGPIQLGLSRFLCVRSLRAVSFGMGQLRSSISAITQRPNAVTLGRTSPERKTTMKDLSRSWKFHPSNPHRRRSRWRLLRK